jgi:hypothetical protein
LRRCNVSPFVDGPGAHKNGRLRRCAGVCSLLANDGECKEVRTRKRIFPRAVNDWLNRPK